MLGSQGLACSLPERMADCEVQARPGIAQHTDFNSLMSGELENCKIIQGSQNVDFAIPARVATLNVQSLSRNAKPLFFQIQNERRTTRCKLIRRTQNLVFQSQNEWRPRRRKLGLEKQNQLLQAQSEWRTLRCKLIL